MNNTKNKKKNKTNTPITPRAIEVTLGQKRSVFTDFQSKYYGANRKFINKHWKGFTFPVYDMWITFDLAKWQDIDDPERFYHTEQWLSFHDLPKSLREQVLVGVSTEAKGRVLHFRGTSECLSLILDCWADAPFLMAGCEAALCPEFFDDNPDTESGNFRRLLRRRGDETAVASLDGWFSCE